MVENIGEIFEGKNYTEEETEDLLFNKIIMQERDSIKDIFDNEIFIDFLNELWDSEINAIPEKKKKMPDSAIFLNNKLVEVIDFFRMRGLSFYDELKRTSLAKLILERVFKLYNDAYNFLNRANKSVLALDNVEETKLNIDEFILIYKEVNTYLMNMFQYQRVSENKLWKYDIEKNIVDSIFSDFFECDDKQKFINKLSIYIKDLEKLRFRKAKGRSCWYIFKIKKIRF